jgi:hypothetical protein
MSASERQFVLASWKHDLNERRAREVWGKGLRQADFWLLVNHVLDFITLPTSEVWMGCHPSHPETPECWMAIRRSKGLSDWQILYAYARVPIRSDPELGAALHRELVSFLSAERHFPSSEPIAFNPFKELKT